MFKIILFMVTLCICNWQGQDATTSMCIAGALIIICNVIQIAFCAYWFNSDRKEVNEAIENIRKSSFHREAHKLAVFVEEARQQLQNYITKIMLVTFASCVMGLMCYMLPADPRVIDLTLFPAYIYITAIISLALPFCK